MKTPVVQREAVSVAGLLAAWLGMWGAWIPHRAVSLSQNAFDLAEWSTFLIDVRSGELAIMPDVLRLALGLCAVALAIEAGKLRRGWIRWGIRALALLPALVLLPPYPDVLKLWWSEAYGLRFGVVSVVVTGVIASLPLGRSGQRTHYISTFLLCVLALIMGGWAFLALRRPFAAHYAMPIMPGWGALLFAGGLTLSAALQIAPSLLRRDQTSNGSVR